MGYRSGESAFGQLPQQSAMGVGAPSESLDAVQPGASYSLSDAGQVDPGQGVLGGSVSGGPLMGFTSNDEIDEARRAAMQERQNHPVVSSLASYVKKCFDAAYYAKQDFQVKMIQAVNQRKGIYEPEVQQLISEQGGTSIFMMLTDEKCVGAEAWLRELLLPANDKPYALKPTAVPDLPPDIAQIITMAVQQKAVQDIQMGMQTGVYIGPEDVTGRLMQVPDEIAEHLHKFTVKMDAEIERRVDDAIQESGWRGALRDFISDLVTFPSAILKGPVPRMRKEMKWAAGGEGGFVPQITEKVQPDWETVSPMDLYPAPMSKSIDDGYVIERHRLARVDLVELKGVDGYDADAIDEVLSIHPNGGTMNYESRALDTQRARAEGRVFEQFDPEGRMEGLQFWGYVSGKMLIDWGMEPAQIPDENREYPCEVWLINNIVIRAELNSDPMGRKPYYKTSFREIPGCFWGMGLVEILSDIQGVCNSAARNIVNNMGLSSGPQVGVDVGRLPDGENVTEMFPWKIWQFDMNDAANGTRPPIWFFQPNNVTAELLKIYEYFSNEADNKSGIPRYAVGMEQGGGALDTASGLSMMMGNASRGIKRVVTNVDFDVIEPSIQRQIEYEFMYNPDGMYKGDIHVMARGTSGMLQKETEQMRRLDLLRLTLSSPVAMTLLGDDAMLELMRKIVTGMDIGIQDYMPDLSDKQREKFQQILSAAAGMQAQGGPGQAQGAPQAPQGPGGPPARMAGGGAPGMGVPGSTPTPGASTPGAPPVGQPRQLPGGMPAGGAGPAGSQMRGVVR